MGQGPLLRQRHHRALWIGQGGHQQDGADGLGLQCQLQRGQRHPGARVGGNGQGFEVHGLEQIQESEKGGAFYRHQIARLGDRMKA